MRTQNKRKTKCKEIFDSFYWKIKTSPLHSPPLNPTSKQEALPLTGTEHHKMSYGNQIHYAQFTSKGFRVLIAQLVDGNVHLKQYVFCNIFNINFFSRKISKALSSLNTLTIPTLWYCLLLWWFTTLFLEVSLCWIRMCEEWREGVLNSISLML